MGESERAYSLLGGIWLIGMGILFATRWWWPGMLFLIAVTAVVEGWLHGRLWYGIQGGFWTAFVGFWALTRFNLAFLFIGLGISAIVGALVRPNPFLKPKPLVDHSLD